ncbi:MAG: hypothetical protein LBH46_01415 [Rickettsiales bacterium]|jgi:hypothetical protein|nr:hypothetical protein [Rickettsiales bacterium]
MLEEYSIDKKSVVLNFSKGYCKTHQDIFNSSCFYRILELYLEKIGKNDTLTFGHFKSCFGETNDLIIEGLIAFFKATIEEKLEQTKIKYKDIFEKQDITLNFIWDFYNYWRSYERYAIFGANNDGNFESITNFTALILKTYRKIRETLIESKNKIYRQLNAGINLSIVLSNAKIYEDIYPQLKGVNFIDTIILQPPFFINNSGETIVGNFDEVNENPLTSIKLDKNKWLCLPLKIADKIAFVYFHGNFMSNGIALSNIFEIAEAKDYENRKPDLILVFGAEDNKPGVRTNFYQDKDKGITIGYISHDVSVDYFGYMKRMLLTIFNIQILDEGKLPVNGYLANITLKNGNSYNIIIVGDSSSGKHETIRAFETLATEYIKEIQSVFSDIGYLYMKDGQIYASGTETGVFMKFTELSGSDTYKTMDRGIFINLENENNIRVATALNSSGITTAGYKVDYFLYANNYEEGTECNIFDSSEEAIKVFTEGKRVVRTDNSKVEESVLFANKYGALQRENETKKLIEKYVKQMIENKVFVGEIRTGASLGSYADKGPLLVARKLFDSIVYSK